MGYRYAQQREATKESTVGLIFSRMPGPDNYWMRCDRGTTTQKIGVPSTSLPCWRTGFGVAGQKFMGLTEQVAQHISVDARQAHQHYGLAVSSERPAGTRIPTVLQNFYSC